MWVCACTDSIVWAMYWGRQYAGRPTSTAGCSEVRCGTVRLKNAAGEAVLTQVAAEGGAGPQFWPRRSVVREEGHDFSVHLPNKTQLSRLVRRLWLQLLNLGRQLLSLGRQLGLQLLSLGRQLSSLGRQLGLELLSLGRQLLSLGRELGLELLSLGRRLGLQLLSLGRQLLSLSRRLGLQLLILGRRLGVQLLSLGRQLLSLAAS